MLRIQNKKRIFTRLAAVFSCIALIVCAAIGLTKTLLRQADALTTDGANVRVVAGKAVYYDNYLTHRFSIYSGDNIFIGFCANPSKAAPSGSAIADELAGSTMRNNKMKLMIYIYSANNTASNQKLGEFFGNNDNFQYAMTHATLGYIYADDLYGLTSAHQTLVRNTSAALESLINSNDPLWVDAQNYQLYGLDLAASGLGSGYQNVVWIEPVEAAGSISIQKCDKDFYNTSTGECDIVSSQGNGSLGGIRFELYNNSGHSIIVDGETYATYDENASDNSAALVQYASTKKEGAVMFMGLPQGTYLVKEASTNVYYNLTDSTPRNITIPITGGTVSQVFVNEIKKGSITVNKKDAEIGTCNSIGAAKLGEASFRLMNRSVGSDSGIYYNGAIIGGNEMIDTKAIDPDTCSVTFENLPYGTYSIEETSAGTGYINTSKNGAMLYWTINIPTNDNFTVVQEVPNQVVRGDVKFVKVDQGGQPMANIPFRITSNTNGESHIVVSDQNGIVDTSANPHTNGTNGYDNLAVDNITYAGYGTWFGGTTENNSLGALPYDTYTITELTCDANKFCHNVESFSKQFTIDTNSVTVDLGNLENNCAEHSLSTTATDKADGDKILDANSTVTISDLVEYCAKAGLEYTVKGVLMNANTKSPVLINGEQVEASYTFTPTDSCGNFVMEYTFDTTGLDGATLVIFEQLIQDGTILIDHQDYSNTNETVTVDKSILPRGDVKFTKVDQNKQPMANIPFRLTAVATGESHVLVTDQDGAVDTSASYTLHTYHTNGYDTLALDGITNQRFGTWFGNIDDIDDLVGALPEGNYTLVELACDANKFCYDVEEVSNNFSITTDGQVVNLGQIANDCAEHSLSTTATDKADGDTELAPGTTVTIADKVDYCAKVGLEYKVKGVLMNKDTESPVLIDGSPVEVVSDPFIPTEPCGSFTMEYTFDTTGLDGATLVIFEQLIYDGEVLIDNHDYNNTGETVTVAKVEVPNTGAFTNHNDGINDAPLLTSGCIIVATFAGYTIWRYTARRKFFKR